MIKTNILNKIISIIIITAILFSFGGAVSTAQESGNVSDKSALTKIEGVIPSGRMGRQVSVDVYADGKTPADITEGVSMKDVIVYHGQTETEIGGAYSFEFETTEHGVLLAYIGSEDMEEPEIRKITIGMPVEFEFLPCDTGYISGGDSEPEFSVRLKNLASGEVSLTLKSRVEEMGKVIWEKNQDIILSEYEERIVIIPVENLKYGIYCFEVEMTDEKGEVFSSAKTDFSKVKTPPIGNKDTNLGVVVKKESVSLNDGIDEMLNKLGIGNVYVKESNTAGETVGGYISAKLSSAQTGHIYFDKEKAEFSAELTNTSGQTFSGTVLCNVSGYGKGEPQKIEIKSGKSVSVTLDGARGRYGFFEAQAEVYDATGDLVTRTAPLRFSVAHIPPEGVYNRELGTNISIRPNQTQAGDPVINLKLAEKAGFGFYRVEVSMGQYNADRAESETGLSEKHQKFFGMLAEKGLSANIILGYGDTSSETYIDEISKYATALVKDPMVKPVVNKFSLLNESDAESKNRTAERYVEILKALRPVIKEANPEATLWGPVSASMSADNEWIKAFFAAGGGDYVDGFDTHRYDHKRTPETALMPTLMKGFKGLMSQYGHGDKPVYVSEHGWVSVGEDGYSDELQQAAYNVRMQFLGDYYDIWDQVASYRFDDTGLTNERETRFGMVRWDESEIPYEAKPLYLAYANYNALMTDAEFIRKIDITDDVPAYLYRMTDGRDGAAVWSVSGDNKVTLNLNTDTVEVYDMYGNKSILYGDNGNYSFDLSEEPVYIIGNFDDIVYSGSTTFEDLMTDIAVIVVSEEPQIFSGSNEQLVQSLLRAKEDNSTVWTELEDNMTESAFSDTPYSAKPLYLIMSAYNAIIGRREYKEKKVLENGVLYRFEKEDGKSVYAIYGEDGDVCDVTLDGVQKLIVYDLYGNETRMYSQTESFSIPVSGEPKYFEADKGNVMVLCNGEKLRDPSAISEGDKVSVIMEPTEIDKNGTLYVAGKSSGVLSFIKLEQLNKEELAKNGVNMEVTADSAVDQICVYIWDENMLPLITAFNLGGYSR